MRNRKSCFRVPDSGSCFTDICQVTRPSGAAFGCTQEERCLQLTTPLFRCPTARCLWLGGLEFGLYARSFFLARTSISLRVSTSSPFTVAAALFCLDVCRVASLKRRLLARRMLFGLAGPAVLSLSLKPLSLQSSACFDTVHEPRQCCLTGITRAKRWKSA